MTFTIIGAGNSPHWAAVSMDGLLGSWVLARKITGQLPISGGASFLPDGTNRLRYREDVVITCEGRSMKAHREYVYVFEGESVIIFHRSGENIGEIFLRLLPVWNAFRGEFVAAGTHLCKLDRYDGEFGFALPDRFSSSYVVQGPAKDYRIETVYRRNLAKPLYSCSMPNAFPG
jgi:Family of unknown function (DUF6314)